MFALAALVLAAHGNVALTQASAHGNAALTQANAAHWQTPAHAAAAATRPSATRIKALERVVRRLDSDDQPASYASTGPSGL